MHIFLDGTISVARGSLLEMFRVSFPYETLRIEEDKRDIEICYTCSVSEVVNWVSTNVRSPGIVGLDVECRPTFRKGQVSRPALVQLAVHHYQADRLDSVLLVHCQYMRDRIPPQELLDVLCDPNIVKCGVGLAQDLVQLQRDFGIDMKNCVDLAHVAVRSPQYVCVGATWCLRIGHVTTWPAHRFGESLSLGGMAERLMRTPKWKSKNLALTRWDQPLQLKAMRCVVGCGNAYAAVGSRSVASLIGRVMRWR